MENLRPFHAAFPVASLEGIKEFYVNLIGCIPGRSDKKWIDLNFFGHQLVFHLSDTVNAKAVHNPVDGDQVPVPHFGIILKWDKWQSLADKLQEAGLDFVIPPRVRFAGKPGEQATFFMRDPNGLYLEFKAFKDDAQLFAV
jgi:extradiol dioxygenase family protein